MLSNKEFFGLIAAAFVFFVLRMLSSPHLGFHPDAEAGEIVGTFVGGMIGSFLLVAIFYLVGRWFVRLLRSSDNAAARN